MSRFLQCFLSAALISCAAVGQEPNRMGEYQLKAQFLSVLFDYVQWPSASESAGKTAPLVIGVLGHSPFQNFLDESCRNRVIKGRRLEVKYSWRLQDLLDCSVLFICETEGYRLLEILSNFSDKPTLTVSDTPAFAAQGTMVNLYLDHKQIRMAINLPALQRSGLRISSHVLKLAKIIQ